MHALLADRGDIAQPAHLSAREKGSTAATGNPINAIDGTQPTEQPMDAVFLPWIGEFGVMLLRWVRYVHWYEATEKIVCCRRGFEVFFPSATAFLYDWPDLLEDRDRVGDGDTHNASAPLLAYGEELKKLYPRHIHVLPHHDRGKQCGLKAFSLVPAVVRGLSTDVVLGVRSRQYKPARNWSYWECLAKSLSSDGYSIGLVGQKGTSQDLVSATVRAWDWGDDPSASIELLSNCRLYIGTDSGASHLAAFCSAPSLVFQYDGDGVGHHVDKMQAINLSYFQFLHNVWDHPDVVAENARRFLTQHPRLSRSGSGR
jgi:hypothetical protein